MSILRFGAMMLIDDADADVDGRRLRRTNNRAAVLDALSELFAEGNYQPSTADIAERAGLSLRSLFRYFDDVDDLYRAAIERALDAARPLLDVGVGVDAPTTVKIDHVVAARIRLYDEIEPAARAARVCAHRHEIVAAQIAESRSFLRHQLAKLFAPEMHGSGRGARVAAVDALLSFESYELLRHAQRLSRPKTAAALTDALGALVGPAS
jgi:AcrR family transcriptional regulator